MSELEQRSRRQKPPAEMPSPREEAYQAHLRAQRERERRAELMVGGGVFLLALVTFVALAIFGVIR